MKKIKMRIGDVVEFKTRKAIAYLQLTHVHKKYGEVVRVLDGVFETRQTSWAELVTKPHRFISFFPVSFYANRKDLSVVGNLPVPEFAAHFPLFRSGLESQVTGRVKNWKLWDGEQSRSVECLTPEERKLPILETPNYGALATAIDEGWTPETDPR